MTVPPPAAVAKNKQESGAGSLPKSGSTASLVNSSSYDSLISFDDVVTTPINKSNGAAQLTRTLTGGSSATTKQQQQQTAVASTTTTAAIDNIRIGGGQGSIVSVEDGAKEKASFYTKLKNPKANDIRKSLTSFAYQFAANGPGKLEDQGQTIINYTRELENWILSNQLWENANEAEVEGVRDGLEKYIMTKVFHCTFMPARLGGLEASDGNIVPEYGLIATEEDLKLYKLILTLNFITPVHLDIQKFITTNSAYIEKSMTELRKMNTYKTPRDKMVCIYNSCKVIFKLLSSLNNTPSGADDFLPILIFVVLKSNPPMLQSNIQMSTETGCYFTHLVSALTFIENIDPANLTIDESEFYRLRDKCEAELPLKHPSISSTPTSQSFFDEDFDFTNSEDHYDDKKYEFINIHIDDLRMGQLPKLLEEYKRLAIENNVLRSKMSGFSLNNSEASSLSSSPALSRMPSWTGSSPNLTFANANTQSFTSSLTQIMETAAAANAQQHNNMAQPLQPLVVQSGSLTPTNNNTTPAPISPKMPSTTLLD
eukprot:gene19473-23324_t